jgi:hypothetical protein
MTVELFIAVEIAQLWIDQGDAWRVSMHRTLGDRTLCVQSVCPVSTTLLRDFSNGYGVRSSVITRCWPALGWPSWLFDSFDILVSLANSLPLISLARLLVLSEIE